MPPTSTDRIEKQVDIKAPLSRVWRALTDHREFGAWFRVNLTSPFVPGKWTRGQITYPGCEYMTMEVLVEKMEPERLFSYRWHPCAVDPSADYSSEPMTLVEFRLEETAEGTRLMISESGFDSIPAHRRHEAFRRNSAGWEAQAANVASYATSNA